MTPSQRAERAIRKAFNIADDKEIPEHLQALRAAIVEEMWRLLEDNVHLPKVE